MGTQKSQPVSIIVSLGFPGSWTEEELCSYVGQLLLDYRPLRGHVLTVKGLSKAEELQECTTPSLTRNMGAWTCHCELCEPIRTTGRAHNGERY